MLLAGPSPRLPLSFKTFSLHLKELELRAFRVDSAPRDVERVGKVVVRIGGGFRVLQAPRRMRTNGGGRAQHEKGGGAWSSDPANVDSNVVNMLILSFGDLFVDPSPFLLELYSLILVPPSNQT